jgi:hypothetical protein
MVRELKMKTEKEKEDTRVVNIPIVSKKLINTHLKSLTHMVYLNVVWQLKIMTVSLRGTTHVFNESA